ncbi:DUF3021 domain-containing protein [Staphylococcus kloosii]|uniref:DUF3021 domain-containing protein n=1 Tax=Staphylococcus kloosii TaxID=29384 RepID=UPI0028A48692|nr:DUF3021 domain-containing protein [Staphylococcus kloosii]MDT3959049.1 DUF3021 domain-containing protein [Staphylococcus kloosii]
MVNICNEIEFYKQNNNVYLVNYFIRLYVIVHWIDISIYKFTRTHTDWRITKTTVMHFVISYIGFLPLAILSGWFPLYISAILMFTLIFIIIYFIMWYINYSKAKKMVAAINNVLKSEHDK